MEILKRADWPLALSLSDSMSPYKNQKESNMITFKHSIDMKTKIYKELSKGVFLLAGMAVLGSCSRDFLDQDPLSFYEPKNTYSTESGLQATLSMERRMPDVDFGTILPANLLLPTALTIMIQTTPSISGTRAITASSMPIRC